MCNILAKPKHFAIINVNAPPGLTIQPFAPRKGAKTRTFRKVLLACLTMA